MPGAPRVGRPPPSGARTLDLQRSSFFRTHEALTQHGSNIELPKDVRKQAVTFTTSSRTWTKNRQRRGCRTAWLLLREIGRAIYNQAARDVQERMRLRVEEIDLEVHEDEFTYWRKFDRSAKRRRVADGCFRPIVLKNSPGRLELRAFEPEVRTMMGSQAGAQEQLFYSFSLEDHVPKDNLLRGIDRFLDLSELRGQLAPFYSHTGRPSVDPVLMIRMLVIGYSLGIRSERRLCEEVHLNLAYRWFCRLGLNEPVPDHSTFSKNRHGRFRQGDVFRHVFEVVLQRCMLEGLVGGEGFAIDASVIKADANRARAIPRL